MATVLAPSLSPSPLEASNVVRLTVIVAVVVLALGLLALVRAQRINQASIERDGLSRFRDALRGRYTELLLSQVYAYLAERRGAVGPYYLVSPTDNLERAYALIDLDLEDAVLVIANRAGVRLPSARELDELKEQVRSVDDLLRYLEPFFRPEVVKGCGRGSRRLGSRLGSRFDGRRRWRSSRCSRPALCRARADRRRPPRPTRLCPRRPFGDRSVRRRRMWARSIRG